MTFTPLDGWSDVVLLYLDEKQRTEGGRWVIQLGWNDAPHLSEAEKADMARKVPPHQRDARMRGIPQLGAGAIYPVPLSEILEDPFEIPPHWPRAFGLDIGWNWNAAVWIAWDTEANTAHLYSSLKLSEAEPWEVAKAIRARGAWIPGVIDPAANGRKLDDGRRMLDIYREHGLTLEAADNAVFAGIQEVWDRLVSKRLKVFKGQRQWEEEYGRYRRDEKGRIVKQNDHLMDATRYGMMSGPKVMCVQRPKKPGPLSHSAWYGRREFSGPHSWMA